MDDIDEYARKLAERARARSRNRQHKAAELPPPKRSLTADDLNCERDDCVATEASPPKRQCLGDEKENVSSAAHSKDCGSVQRSRETPSALGPKNTEDCELVPAPRHVFTGQDDLEAPRGLAALRRKRDTSPDSASEERLKAEALRRAPATDDGFTRTPRGLAALRKKRDLSPESGVAPATVPVPEPPSAAKVTSDKPKKLGGSAGARSNNGHVESSRKNRWDPKVIASLEAQGFTKSPSASKLSYSFKPSGGSVKGELHEGPTSAVPAPPPPPMPSPQVAAPGVTSHVEKVAKAAVSNAEAIRGQPANHPCSDSVHPDAVALQRDPSELSLQERKALFEAAVHAEQEEDPACVAPESLSVAQRKALFEHQMKQAKAAAERSKMVAKPHQPCRKPPSSNQGTNVVSSSCCEKEAPAEPERHCGVAEARARLEAKLAQQGDRELTPEYHSFKTVTLQPASGWGATLGQSPVLNSRRAEDLTCAEVPVVATAATDMTAGVGSGMLEGCDEKPFCDTASEDESDRECDDSASDTSLSRGQAPVVSSEDAPYVPPEKRPNEICGTTDYDESYALMKALEEEIAKEKAALAADTLQCETMLRNQPEADPIAVSPQPEQSASTLRKEVSKNRLYPELPPMDWNDVPVVVPPPKPSRAPPSPEDDQPLVHTQSVYRRFVSTPVRHVEPPAQPSVVQLTPTAQRASQLGIQDQIKALQREVEAQEVVMAQASRALEVCRQTMEFSGSAERVEGERLLLLATERRKACLAEVERLKTRGGCGGADLVVPERACLTLSQLQLPLKREFLAAQLEGTLGDDVHYFLCLVSHGAQVLSSQMLSTADNAGSNALCFSNHMTLRDLRADFTITLQIYALQTKKETLPHRRKYRIGGKDGKLKLTPKSSSKGSATKGVLSPATVCAPPVSTVSTPSFGLVGFLQVKVSNCRRSTFVLEKVPNNSPLEGTLLVQLMLRPEHHDELRGFLSMFEEVGGFGAWHRRWCVLAENRLSYWRYPEDETSKEPVGCLQLSRCTSPDARLVSRDICARPHTLVLRIDGHDYLLSADSKEDRERWCCSLTAVLRSLRIWAGMGHS